MEKIDFVNIFLAFFAIGLVVIPRRKLSQKKIFLLGVALFSVGSLFSLVKYIPVAEIYFRFSLVGLGIGIVKAGMAYKDGN